MAYDSMRTPESEAYEIMLSAGARPMVPYVNGKTPWESECLTCGRTVTPRLANVKNSGARPCAHCSRSQIESADACRLMLEAGAIPLDPYSGSTKNPWRSLCLKCNQEITPRLANIKKGNGPCRRCAPNASVLPSVAESEMRAIGLTPLEPFQGAMTPWRCLCEMCGMEVTPRLNSIRKGYGCKGCAQKGFKVGIPSIIYVIKHAGIRAVKVGVANRTSGRVRSFESRGWTSVRVDEVCCGAHAMGTETRVLREIRKTRRIPPLPIAKTVSLSGWTETSSLDAISVEELVSLVDLHEGARC